MKTLFKFALLLVIMVSSSVVANAQINYDDPKWKNYGATTEEREKNVNNYSFFREAIKMNSFADAERRLQELVANCPKANETMYHFGIIIYRDFMNEAKDNETRDKHLNNLIKMYDLRIEHFGDVVMKDGKLNKNVLVARKMDDLMKLDFVWDEKQDLLSEQIAGAIKISGCDINPSIPLVYFKILVDRFYNNLVDPEVILTEYENMYAAIFQCSDTNKTNMLKTIDNLLIDSQAASCENLEAMFKIKYEKDPNNLELIKKIISFMTKNECEGDFKTMLSEKYYKLDPSAAAAYALANTFVAQKELTKAVTYFNEAISREKDNATRSSYESRLAAVYLMLSEPRKAVTAAQKAINSDVRNGLAYYFIAQAYGMLVPSTKPADEFQKKAVYWYLYDLIAKAKANLPSNSPHQKNVEKLLTTFKAHFPSKEDIFFKELKVGAPFTVDCDWIKGKTTVK